MKKLPIGIDDYKIVISDNYYFVDKTFRNKLSYVCFGLACNYLKASIKCALIVNLAMALLLLASNFWSKTLRFDALPFFCKETSLHLYSLI